MPAYYNEFDPKAAAWLRELIKAGHIAPGDVDERSIADVQPSDLAPYDQCHFFAGIGGWSYALRLAGVPDSLPVWTGSCPCQPFSAAGKGQGTKDDRHLWPSFARLIEARQPAIVFGEQVASKNGRVWLSGVFADLEGMAYQRAGADLCAAGVSAPHIRQRLYWLAVSQNFGRGKEYPNARGEYEGDRKEGRSAGSYPSSASLGVGDTNGYHRQWWSGPLQVGWNGLASEIERGGRKYRAQWRTQPGLSMLADGIPGRVAQLCGFGNAIVPQVAAEFIQAALDAL